MSKRIFTPGEKNDIQYEEKLETNSNSWNFIIETKNSETNSQYKFVNLSISLNNQEKSNKTSEISIPFQFKLVFGNSYEYRKCIGLSQNKFEETISYPFNPKEDVYLEDEFIPFLPVKCAKEFYPLFYSAYCSYFMQECDLQKGKPDKRILHLLNSLIFQPVSITEFTELIRITQNDQNLASSPDDFLLLDSSPATQQETLSSLIFDFFASNLNVNIYRATGNEIGEIPEGTSAVLVLRPCIHSMKDFILKESDGSPTLVIDENNEMTEQNFELYSICTYERPGLCCYYYSHNLKSGFRIFGNKIMKCDREKWPHEASILSIFVNENLNQKLESQSFSKYKNKYKQIVDCYQFSFHETFSIANYVNEKNGVLCEENFFKFNDWFFGRNFVTKEFILSMPNVLTFRYDKHDNLFPAFSYPDFGNSCLAIKTPQFELLKTEQTKDVSKVTPAFDNKADSNNNGSSNTKCNVLWQIIWLQNPTKEYRHDYYLGNLRIDEKINHPIESFLPTFYSRDDEVPVNDKPSLPISLNLSKCERKIGTNEDFFSFYLVLAKVKDHCVRYVCFEKHSTKSGLGSLVYFACGKMPDKRNIPIAIRFGERKGNGSKVSFYGTPKLDYIAKDDVNNFIEKLRKSFEGFNMYYLVFPSKWRKLEDPSKAIAEIGANIITQKVPYDRQLYHIMLMKE
ncbi:hypothetical protein TRFO_34529 [Tritrichomonas foetus]|uniref:Uncharacterized protein n=1 Tax=Tritrichomonas foetus TaxID=1144522 RepID=A0A1J4JNN6_9EUKA|nr:hypothetical protein TRFO_34529 [Tritrichomonas foetus]|eukprot:OHS99125.1 hypothetical protein TRFO_34529 [Tritrichomonas foetus]